MFNYPSIKTYHVILVLRPTISLSNMEIDETEVKHIFSMEKMNKVTNISERPTTYENIELMIVSRMML